MKLPITSLMAFAIASLIAASAIAQETAPAPETEAASPSQNEPEPTPPPGVNSASYPLPRVGKGGGWKGAHERLVKRVQTDKCGVLFIGDSITQHWTGKDKGGEVWKQYYAPLNAVSIGMAGDRTENILWRLQNGGIGKVKPKVTVLLAGINNINKNTAPEIAEGILAIVTEVQKQLPETKILLLGVFPKGAAAESADRGKIKEINSILEKAAVEKKITFLDIGGAFLAADGSLSKEIMPDGLHPGAKGYEIWAKAMDPTLKSLMGPATPGPGQ